MIRLRQIGLRRGLVIALGLAMLPVLALAWPGPPSVAGGPHPFTLLRSSTPEGPVIVTGVDTGLIWSRDSLPTTTITVRNETQRAATCEVWWILAGQGEAKPWDHPTMQGLPVGLTLGPTNSQTVGVNEVAAFPTRSGVFGLSLWVHCRNPVTGQWAPSDGATMGGAVEFLETPPSLSEAAGNSRLIWVDGATTPERLIQGHLGQVDVSVSNAWIEPAVVQVECYLAPPGVLQPWTDAHARRCRVAEVNLAASGLTSVDLTIPRLPKSGRYQLSVWVRLQRATSSVPIGGVRVRPEVAISA